MEAKELEKRLFEVLEAVIIHAVLTGGVRGRGE